MAKQSDQTPATEPRRIGSVIREEDALPPIKTVDEFQNQELILVDFEEHESTLPQAQRENKKYFVMTVHFQDDPENFQIRTGAETICRQLSALSKLDDLPMPIRIERHGNTRMWKLT